MRLHYSQVLAEVGVAGSLGWAGTVDHRASTWPLWMAVSGWWDSLQSRSRLPDRIFPKNCTEAAGLRNPRTSLPPRFMGHANSRGGHLQTPLMLPPGASSPTRNSVLGPKAALDAGIILVLSPQRLRHTSYSGPRAASPADLLLRPPSTCLGCWQDLWFFLAAAGSRAALFRFLFTDGFRWEIRKCESIFAEAKMLPSGAGGGGNNSPDFKSPLALLDWLQQQVTAAGKGFLYAVALRLLGSPRWASAMRRTRAMGGRGHALSAAPPRC